MPRSHIIVYVLFSIFCHHLIDLIQKFKAQHDDQSLDMESTNSIGSNDDDSDLTSRKFNDFFVDEQEVMLMMLILV